MDNNRIERGGFMHAKQEFESICKENDFEISDILSPRRDALVVEKRRIIAKIMREKKYSYPKIGYAMDRDHASIMNLISPKSKKVKNDNA